MRGLSFRRRTPAFIVASHTRRAYHAAPRTNERAAPRARALARSRARARKASKADTSRALGLRRYKHIYVIDLAECPLGSLLGRNDVRTLCKVCLAAGGGGVASVALNERCGTRLT